MTDISIKTLDELIKTEGLTPSSAEAMMGRTGDYVVITKNKIYTTYKHEQYAREVATHVDGVLREVKGE